MKKIFLISTLCLTFASHVSAQTSEDEHVLDKETFLQSDYMINPLQPTYLKNVTEAANWGYNWFIEIKGGASAFLGSPIGCGDVFDRLKPTLQVGLGKWFTPAIGGRVGYQGLELINAEFNAMKYHFVHADFMYNITGMLNQNERGISKWDVIPFVGIGMIHNSTDSPYSSGGGNHPFAFSYGMEMRYRLNNRMHIVAEVSGLTTLKNFDCVGTSSHFGDNMLSVSAGLSFTLGKVGWKRVVDAKPYIEQNILLRDYLAYMRDENVKLEKRLAGEETEKRTYPKNSYSGLISLRARLANTSWDGNEKKSDDESKLVDTCRIKSSVAYGDSIISGHANKITVGVPVYFFFKLNTDELVDMSQLVNLDEIANIAKTNGYRVSISGAADSATGTDEINQNLSHQRSMFIAQELKKRGVKEEKLVTQNYGGINKYLPIEANRCTIVVLMD